MTTISRNFSGLVGGIKMRPYLSLCAVVFACGMFSSLSEAQAASQFFPPENETRCNGSVSGPATGRSVLTWDGGNDVSCRDLPPSASAVKTDAQGNFQRATAADVSPLVTVTCASGQVIGSISNGTPVCVTISNICTSLGGTWDGSKCNMAGSALTQSTCHWVGVPGGSNGNNGTKQATCPDGYYVAGHGNYREGDWTRTGYNQFYCCKSN